MKIEPRRVQAFLADPGGVRVVLLHGEDEGMVRHRAGVLTQAVLGRGDDPFRLAWLAREDHDRLAEEADAIAMTGGRRVVRVRDAGDALAAAVRRVGEAGGDSLVILEAGALLGAWPMHGDPVAMARVAKNFHSDPEPVAAADDHLSLVRGQIVAAAGLIIVEAGIAAVTNRAVAERRPRGDLYRQEL